MHPVVAQEDKLNGRLTDVLTAIIYPQLNQPCSGHYLHTLQKRPCQDFVTRNDLFLVLAYHRRVGEALFDDIEARSLTVYCAVKAGDGP